MSTLIQGKSGQTEQKQICWQDFLKVESSSPEEIDMVSFKIRNAFRALLEQFEDSEFIKYLVAPSPEALSGYFQCTVKDIEEALQALKQLGYDYESRGPHQPITLWDPLIRTQPKPESSPSRLRLLYENFFMIPAFSH